MPGPVLISSYSGSGHPADEALVAAARRLLERGAWGASSLLSLDVGVSARAHPDMTHVAEDALEAALADCRLLMVVGDLSVPERRHRAARHVLWAKNRGVPVALVSVRLRSSCDDAGDEDAALQVLAQAESITTCDTTSAAVLARCVERRVATTAPLELVLAAKPTPLSSDVIGVDAEALDELADGEGERLLHGIAAFAVSAGMRVRLVCALRPPKFAVPDGVECVATPAWTAWMRALSQTRICVGRADSVALHLAVAQGAIPIATTGSSDTDLAERIGLYPGPAGLCPRSWHELLERALRTGIEDVCARSAPLRAVAWRALGSLTEAVRSRALPVETPSSLQRCAARVLLPHWQQLLDAGQIQMVEEELRQWGCLAAQPSWAAARARAWILQGNDTAARHLLEEALTNDAGDTDCLALLAMVLWRHGDLQAADRCWQHIVGAGGEAARRAEEQRQDLRMWQRAHTPNEEGTGPGIETTLSERRPPPEHRSAG